MVSDDNTESNPVEFMSYKPYFTSTELTKNNPYTIEISTLALAHNNGLPQWMKSRASTKISTRTVSTRYGFLFIFFLDN